MLLRVVVTTHIKAFVSSHKVISLNLYGSYISHLGLNFLLLHIVYAIEDDSMLVLFSNDIFKFFYSFRLCCF